MNSNPEPASDETGEQENALDSERFDHIDPDDWRPS